VQHESQRDLSAFWRPKRLCKQEGGRRVFDHPLRSTVANDGSKGHEVVRAEEGLRCRMQFAAAATGLQHRKNIQVVLCMHRQAVEHDLAHAPAAQRTNCDAPALGTNVAWPQVTAWVVLGGRCKGQERLIRRGDASDRRVQHSV
jgi:hypothetical protein